MDPPPDHPNLPRIGPHHIPDDVIIYLLDFLDSTAIATMALATRHLQALVTPTLYRTITIPGKEGNHIRSAAILLRTLSKRPSLTALVRHLENAPPLIPPLVLESVWLENTPPSNSLAAFAGQGGYAQSWSHSLPVEVMKSCVNLQTLTVCGTITSYMIAEADKWLNFLLDPKIKLKSLKLLVNPTNGMIRNIWNNFIAQILDVQSSLEDLDYPFDDKYPVEKERTESWAPKLRMLCGNDVCGFKALLSPKRSIETLVVRSIPVTDIRRCFGAQLNEASTVEEFVYQGPKVGSTNFADLFEMVPSLKIFRGETWLSAMNPLEDLFWEELPQAFAWTPHLTEFHLRPDNRLPVDGESKVKREFLHLYQPSRNKEWPRHQAALLERYSNIWPQLRVFTFPDGRQWRWMKDKWVFQDQFTRKVAG